MAQPDQNDMLVHQARAVLDFNWTGEYTMPGPRLYPHQWSWDSALIAIGYSHYAQKRATKGSNTSSRVNGRTVFCPRSFSTPASLTTSRDPTSGTLKKAPMPPKIARPPAWSSRPFTPRR